MRAAHTLGFSGLNVTHPCKQLVVEHLDELSPDAEALGAVNTVVFDDGRAIGHNTDWPGFQENFERGLPDVSTERVVLVGAGGAGSAVAHAAISLGVERLVDRRRRRRARGGAGRLAARGRRGRRSTTWPASWAPPTASSTPRRSGMEAHDGAAFSPDLLRESLWVADVVYRPLETELLRHARQLGCRTLDGGGMAVFQAALSFALFTGREPDRERMLRHFAALVGEAEVARA